MKIDKFRLYKIFVSTIISVLSLQLSYVILQWDYFVCPISFDTASNRLSMDCERHPVFKIAEYSLPETLDGLFTLVCCFMEYLSQLKKIIDGVLRKMLYLCCILKYLLQDINVVFVFIDP